MRFTVIIALALCALLSIDGAAAQADPTAIAQADTAKPRMSDKLDVAALESATNRAVDGVRAAQRARARLAADKAKLAKRYERELASIDRLKRQRASWRRDRQIRTQLTASLATANRLSKLDARLRKRDAQLSKLRRRMLDAVEAELAAGARAVRRERLVTWRREALRKLRRVKKIVLPDLDIDPLADPEELEYQASLLRQSERQLERELASLARQADKFKKMTALRKKRARAAELGRFDDNEPRRGGVRDQGRVAADGDGDSFGEGAGPPQPQDPASDLPDDSPQLPDVEVPMFEGDPVLVLSEVVDAGTLQALRRADRSSDPAVKARAARRAHDEVRERLERLRARRAQIQRRASQLRGK